MDPREIEGLFDDRIDSHPGHNDAGTSSAPAEYPTPYYESSYGKVLGGRRKPSFRSTLSGTLSKLKASRQGNQRHGQPHRSHPSSAVIPESRPSDVGAMALDISEPGATGNDRQNKSPDGITGSLEPKNISWNGTLEFNRPDEGDTILLDELYAVEYRHGDFTSNELPPVTEERTYTNKEGHSLRLHPDCTVTLTYVSETTTRQQSWMHNSGPRRPPVDGLCIDQCDGRRDSPLSLKRPGSMYDLCTWPGCSHKSAFTCQFRNRFRAKRRPDTTLPYKCPHCVERFAWPKDVRRHLKWKHEERPVDKTLPAAAEFAIPTRTVKIRLSTWVHIILALRSLLNDMRDVVDGDDDDDEIWWPPARGELHDESTGYETDPASILDLSLTKDPAMSLATQRALRELDQDSMHSYHSDVDSIFSEPMPMWNGPTSRPAKAKTLPIPDELIQDFFSVLFCTKDLQAMGASAVENPDIGAEQYEKQVRCSIEQYGKSLECEAIDDDQAGAAKLLQSRSVSTRIARYAVPHAEHYILQSMFKRPGPGEARSALQEKTANPELVKAMFPRLDAWLEYGIQQERDQQERDRENLSNVMGTKSLYDALAQELADRSEAPVEHQDNIDIENYNIQTLQYFLPQSKAYGAFREQLMEFIHVPYEDRILRAIGTDITLENGRRPLGKESIRAIGKDISWTPVRLIRISNTEACPIGDCIKGWIEDKLGETWNWWPLQQVNRPLAPGCSRVHWLSVSLIAADVRNRFVNPHSQPFGAARYVDIPSKAALALQQAVEAVNDVPAFLNTIDTIPPAQNPASQHHSGNTSTSAQSPNPGSVSNSAKRTSTQHHRYGPPACNNAAPSNGQAKPTPQPPAHRHVFLCVRRGSSHKFIDMSTHLMHSDGEFFASLKENYLHLRGRLRRYFSIWRYDRCDFYQFQKYDINKGAPYKESFPPSSNAGYDFLPRPIDPSPPGGPISDQEFRDRFYKSCHHCQSWHLHHREQFRNTPTIQHAAKDALALLPKRKDPLHMDDGAREQFWGIYARERRCFAWVLAYGLLFNLPGVLFFFLWLFRWKHASDLQNAAVPVGMSISLTMLFVALLFETREKDRG